MYPKPGETIKFESFERLDDVPFSVYADFESFVEPVQLAERDPSKSFTTKYQNHIPSGFCYVIKCVDKSVYPTKTVLQTASYEGEDMGKAFVDSLTEDLRPIYEILNLWERANKCAQEMQNIRLLADKDRLQDAVNNIGVAFRVMEMLTETSDKKIVNKNVKDIATEILDNDDESLTDVSLTDVSEYDSDSD